MQEQARVGVERWADVHHGDTDEDLFHGLESKSGYGGGLLTRTRFQARVPDLGHVVTDHVLPNHVPFRLSSLSRIGNL